MSQEENTVIPGTESGTQEEPSGALHGAIEEAKRELADETQIRPKRKYIKSGKYSKKPGGAQDGTETAPPDELDGLSDIVIPPEEIDAMFSDVANIPFDWAAEKTNFEGFKLEPNIAGKMGHQLNLIIQVYAPGFAKKHPVLFAFILTAGFQAYTKIKKYQEFQRIKKIAPTPSKESNTQ